MIHVACLVTYPLDRVPGQRFRVEQWAKHLEAHGIVMEFLPLLSPDAMDVLYRPGHFVTKARGVLEGSAARVAWAARRARDYDVVVIFREAMLLGIDWVERYLTRRVPTVFDFDDAIWLPNISKANRIFGRLKSFSKIDRILGMVTSVSAGCEYLAARARIFNERVHIVPTSIDLEQYSPPREHTPSDVLTVGWTGSVTTAPYLETLIPAIQRAAQQLPLRLHVLGAELAVPGVEVRCEKWTPTAEVPFIRTFDIGVKPQVREEWARGKCPMKDVQYMALGVPCVATKFGTALESIEHGVSGMLCDTDEDWVDAFEHLRDTATRARMGIEARRVVEQRYSATVAAAAFAGSIEDARTGFSRRRAAS